MNNASSAPIYWLSSKIMGLGQLLRATLTGLHVTQRPGNVSLVTTGGVRSDSNEVLHAKRTTRPEASSGRDRSRRHGGKARNGRSNGNSQAKVRPDKERKGRVIGSRKIPVVGEAFADRQEGGAGEVGVMAAPIPAIDLAREICARSEWKVTNLSLQKIIYILNMFYSGTHGGIPLITAEFEAWDHGPVIPGLYHKLKGFGASPVRDIFSSAQPIKDAELVKFLDENLPKVMVKRPAELVAITHQSLGAWEKRYRTGIKGIKISQQDVLEEFNSRADRAKRRAAASVSN